MEVLTQWKVVDCYIQDEKGILNNIRTAKKIKRNAELKTYDRQGGYKINDCTK